MLLMQTMWWVGTSDSSSSQAAPLEAITLRARAQGIRVDHLLHDDPAHFVSMGFIASQSEVCLVFVSVFLKENQDREPGLRLDKGGEDLIRAVEARCAGEVVVIIHAGGQVIVEDWVSAGPGIS